MQNTVDRNPGIEGFGLYLPFDSEIQEAFSLVNDAAYLHDYLQFIIRRSQCSADLYDYAALITEGEDIKVFFSDAAGAKRNGASYLYQVHETNFLFEDASTHTQDPIFSYLKMSAGLKYVEDITDACHFVVQNELNDLLVYKNLAEQEENPAAKNLFHMVVKLQKSQIRSVLTKLSISELESARRKYASFPAFSDRESPDCA